MQFSIKTLIRNVVFVSLTFLLAVVSNATDKNSKMVISGLSAGTYNSTDEDFAPGGWAYSLLSAGLQSFDLNWSINGSETYTTSFSGINLLPYEKYYFQPGQYWTPDVQGQVPLKVWITNVNGEGSGIPGSDTLSRVLEFYPDMYPKNGLIESFSSINCGSCVVAGQYIKNIIEENYDRLTALLYHPQLHENSPLSVYNPNDTKARAEYYNVTGTPYAVVPGIFFGYALDLSQQIIELELQKRTPFHIQGYYTLDDERSTINVSLSSSIETNNPDFRLFVVLLEEHVSFPEPPGSNGDSAFYYVMRSFISGPEGFEIPLLPSGEIREFYSKFDSDVENLDQDELSVIAFVQNRSTREVLQAVRLTKGSVGYTQYLEDSYCRVFPNPASEILYIKPTKEMKGEYEISVYHPDGKLLRSLRTNFSAYGSIAEISIADLPVGLYMVEIKGQVYRQTEKLIIAR